MRRVCVLLVVAALAFGSTTPAVAQPQVEPAAWSWGVFTERLIGWAEGVWNAIAGSETGALPEDDGSTDGVAVDGGEQLPTDSLLRSTNEAYPGFDPDG